jgi:hypothetical protein
VYVSERVYATPVGAPLHPATPSRSLQPVRGDVAYADAVIALFVRQCRERQAEEQNFTDEREAGNGRRH